jgi:hypothetical protein
MLRHLKISQKINKILCILIIINVFSSELHADIYDDEDEVFYDITVARNFRIFFKKHQRYPRSWIELGVRDHCYGGKDNLPKANEGLVWHPSDCEMSYQLVYSNQRAFKVVALKSGHIVSIYENYKATYLDTPYHDHSPDHCAGEDIAC